MTKSSTTAALVDTPDTELEGARLMLERARWAAARLARMSLAETTGIVEAMADAGAASAERYAEWAVRETGMGVVAHKKIKNEICSHGIVAHYSGQDFVTPRIDADKKIVEVPRPAGVIFALTPVTNPIATVYFKAILALMTRNAIVLSPHPQAKACCTDAVRMLAAAAEAAGAPEGAIQVLAEPTIPLIEALMADPRVDLIVATGGPAVVRAAYRSGHPAYGVGPGNAPAVVDETADIEHAARCIVESNAFDNAILCTNESVILAVASIAEGLLKALAAAQAHICTAEEVNKLRAYLFSDSGFNTAAIGKDAAVIARDAGFRADRAKMLVAPIALVQPEEKLAREKLCPVVAFATVADVDEAIVAARSMMRHVGKGHSAAIHSHNEKNIIAFAAEAPALRIVVNVGCSQGASGLHTFLSPSMTVGTGFVGGSSLADNLEPGHFVNFARIAVNKDVSQKFGNFTGLDVARRQRELASGASREIVGNVISMDNLLSELRKIIVEELRHTLDS
jgi:acetaldehyde dehydrogenase / alcohol dehydrogenase